MKVTLELDTLDIRSVQAADKMIKSLTPITTNKYENDRIAFTRVFGLDTKDLTHELISDFLDSVRNKYGEQPTIKTVFKTLENQQKENEPVSNVSILKYMLNANFKIRAERVDNGINANNRFKFAREFQTVRLQLGRQTGHTTLAKYVLNNMANSCYISKSLSCNLISTFGDFDKHKIIQFDSNMLYTNRDKHFENIVIDDASLFTISELNLIYETFGKTETQTFILLG